jgi:glucokinase
MTSDKASGKTAAKTEHRTLLADIGGTNARFALLEGGEIGAVQYVKVADFATVGDAVADVLARSSDGTPVTMAVLAVAGPVTNNRCVMTNSPWIIDGAELRAIFGFESVDVLNDFEVLAWSLPALELVDLFPVGSHPGIPGEPMLVLGPGTGFGVSCLIQRHGVRLAVVTEAGHATLPA